MGPRVKPGVTGVVALAQIRLARARDGGILGGLGNSSERGFDGWFGIIQLK